MPHSSGRYRFAPSYGASASGFVRLISIARLGSGSLGRKSLEGEPSHDALASSCDIPVAAYVFC